jgi:hypothetical protein
MRVDGCEFVFGLPFVPAADGNSGNAPEVVIGILSRAVDHQVGFLVHQILPFVLAHLGIRRQLNRIGGARLFAIATENAAGKIDAEEFRIPSAMLVLRCLERDAVHRTGHGAEITRDAAFSPVRVTGEDNTAPIPGREVGFLLRILNRHTPRKSVSENFPQRSHQAEHRTPPSPPGQHYGSGH